MRHKMNLKVSKKKLLEFLPKSVRVPDKLKIKKKHTQTSDSPPENQNRLLFRQVSYRNFFPLNIGMSFFISRPSLHSELYFLQLVPG